MIRKRVVSSKLHAALSAAALICACSKPAPPAPAVERQPSEAELAAAKPSSVRFAMAGEVNAMPSLAVSGDRIAVVWTGTKSGAMNVYTAISEDGGITFPMQKRVNDQDGDVSANVEQPPRVAMSGSRVAVVWSSRKSGNSAIRMSRSNDGGRTFNPAVTIHNPSLKGARGWESLAAGADGSVRVAWLDGRDAQSTPDAAAQKEHMAEMAAKGADMDHSKMSGGSPRQDVYEAVIDQNGKVAETQVATNVCFCCKTAVAIDSRGRVNVAWRNIFPGSIRDIAMAISTDVGHKFGPLARVSEDKWEIEGCPEDGPAMAIDSSDAVHIVWPTVVNEGKAQKAVFYASTKDGRTFTPRVRLSGPDQEEAAHPQVAVGASGAVAAVWDEPHGGVRQVVFRTAGPDGQLGVGRTLSSGAPASHPVIAAVAGGFLVAWTEGEAAGSAILLRRVGAGQPASKPGPSNEHAFRGYVESVEPDGTIMVNGENVEGWMGPMTMMYGVDSKDVLGRLKVGDRISAKVYDGDFKTLHAVEIVPR
jgi:hypothetical protein